MSDSLRIRFCVGIALVIAASALSGFAAPPGTLQVGAARVDITPAADAALPMAGYSGRTEGFKSIHDHIYVRAIVFSDGTNYGGLLAWELIFMPTPIWETLSQRISKELGIPVENMILAGVHDHNAPGIGGMFGGRPPTAGAAARGGRPPRPPSPGALAYTTKVENDAFEAVRQAKANLQPAQFGFGTGIAYVNINRREFFPQDGWWWLGYNPDAPSDKTVAVVKFADLSGKPIALFINYPVHAVVMGDKNLSLSGDLAGATSRYVEQYYQGKIETHTRGDYGLELEVGPETKVGGEGPVALWTSGAAGNQNPVAMEGDEDFTLVNTLGTILGQEAVRVANKITAMSSQASITGAQRVISCSVQRAAPGPRPRKEYTWEDSPDSVSLRLSLVRINNVALTGVSGEIFTQIGQHLKKDSPLNDTVMITHANGSSGYIPGDDSFNVISYENSSRRIQQGCAESGIVNGLVQMIGAQ